MTVTSLFPIWSFSKYGLNSYLEPWTEICAGVTMVKETRQFPPMSTISHTIIFTLNFLKPCFCYIISLLKNLQKNPFSYLKKFKFFCLESNAFYHLTSAYLSRIFTLFNILLSWFLATGLFAAPYILLLSRPCSPTLNFFTLCSPKSYSSFPKSHLLQLVFQTRIFTNQTENPCTLFDTIV